MTSREDKRNLKCFFGMHQWEVFREMRCRDFSKESDKLPSRVFTRYTLKCAFCGELRERNI